ncbi:general secretion pathway protein F [Lebetimonas natsushimae]|uniref:General secretion pathway protein F n=1 Tax=Lebetimonas natsushimae TaxID=1936991 RepID=A0A292YBB0_9BACT|nr:type II secretion system F family protein [Lebetimonas natsushimae]GAX87387.1 general secretion pathway protein F [Lebetimonas natsushimae]
MKYYKATFIYKGKKEDLILKAQNRSEAIIKAKKLKKGLLVEINEIPIPFEEKLKIFKDIVSNKILRKRLNYPAYISSLKQLAVLLKAGISLKDALEDIANHTKDSLISELFAKAAEAIDSGKALSDVFEEYENYIGGISVAMVKLGEQTGDLVAALEGLAQIFENMYENRRKMIKALRYPVITLFAIAGAFVFLVLVVVPKFKAVFASLHAKLPLPTRMLLWTEHALSNYGGYILFALIIITILLIFFYKTSYKFKYFIDKNLLKMYLIGSIIEYSTLSRVLNTLGTLIKSGIPLLDALQNVEGIVENEILREKLKEIIKGINQGRSFAEMVNETNFVNYVAIRMINAGEQSGELDSMLESAANYYNDKFQDIIDNMQAAIEPIMLSVIGVLVLWLALGIFLPMWDLASAAKNAM